ncbi:MAG: type VI secretion system contractile sheath large subunit [Rhodocyclaceae bacterium]|nr:type VI secretion system contractile sheath large subunit [Rhodocyclaceae bacterium]
MDFDFSFGRPSGGEPRDEAPFRLLVLGNFSGHGGLPLAQRVPVAVDIDSIDQVLARFAPRLALDLGDATVALAFSEIEDFHPDAIYERVDLFAGLRGLRQELRDPALFARAAAALGAAPTGTGAVDGDAAADETGGDIERLLGRKPSGPAMPAGHQEAAAQGIDALIRNVVAPHVVHDNPQQQQVMAAADDAIADHMRRVLHHPEFQALEALWRSVERMVRELDCGETLELYLMDYSRQDLLADVSAHADNMAASTIQRLLCGREGAGAEGRRWSVVALDQAFGPDAAEMALLTLLSAMAAKSGSALLAGARPALLGCDSVQALASAAEWPAADEAAFSAWNALRASGVAASVGLALPGVLVRLPYGKATDPVSAFAFEEMAAGRDHGRYLWGPPALALATLCGQAFQQEGWAMDPDDVLDLEDLPSHVYREDGEAGQQPCAEILMSEPAGNAALARGVMPLLSYRNRNAARLMRWQSIGIGGVPIAGPWQSG